MLVVEISTIKKTSRGSEEKPRVVDLSLYPSFFK